MINHGSFRDVSGFVYSAHGRIYRQVNTCYKEEYDHLISSGLYQRLITEKKLIEHQIVDPPICPSSEHYKTLSPNRINFISYPYEWSFSQWKDAALLTLEVCKTALEYSMILKDASAYNIQFDDGRPIFIDTLSFDLYCEGEPWIAYRQFCQHFFAPLALMSSVDIRLGQLLKTNIDGIPLDLASRLLPWRKRLKLSFLFHIYLHARSQRRYANRQQAFSNRKVSKQFLSWLLNSLSTGLKKLGWKPEGAEWADYYVDTNYSELAFSEKKRLTHQFLTRLTPGSMWDFGANTGVFSRLAAELDWQVVSFDLDPAAVEKNYSTIKKNKEKNILPLVQDLTNPSPPIGWALQERNSLIERGPVHACLSLALIHHLVISNNAPFFLVAEFFSRLCQYLIIEFVPREDSQVQRLLSTRKDIFQDYNEKAFERAFSERFKLLAKESITESGRVLYLMEKAGD